MMTSYKKCIHLCLCLGIYLCFFFFLISVFSQQDFFFKLGTIPTDLEQATGVERKELEAILAGNPVSIALTIINLYFYDHGYVILLV